jgi:hypothetical protein
MDENQERSHHQWTWIALTSSQKRLIRQLFPQPPAPIDRTLIRLIEGPGASCGRSDAFGARLDDFLLSAIMVHGQEVFYLLIEKRDPAEIPPLTR